MIAFQEAIPPGASETEILTALDRLGEAEQIVEEERGRSDARPVRGGWFEWITVSLLLVGGVLLPILGWVVSAVFLWGSEHCTGGQSTTTHVLWVLLFAALVIAPIATAVYLTRRAQRSAPQTV